MGTASVRGTVSLKNPASRDVLVKLGMAIYVHASLMDRAEKGKAAAERLAGAGVFNKGSK